MMKDLFSGSLGKLNNHGGSRIYTTPNTILVPPEYEVDIGKHGDFVTCSLDGRLWVFKDKIIALKWNEETGRMEFSTSRSFNNDKFIQRGIDWILTARYIIQYNDGKILVEAHKIPSLAPMEKFYSLLPAIDGFQIIKGYLIRKPNSGHSDLVYPVKDNSNFLVPINSDIYGKNFSQAGRVTIEGENNEYELKIASSYPLNNGITGLCFLGNSLFGFQAEENSEELFYSSRNLDIFSFNENMWRTLSEETGKIYFDIFNRTAIALHDKGIEILPYNKIVECLALKEWIAPTNNKKIHYISNSNIISVFNKRVLETNLFCKYYRNLLQNNKELSITAVAYQNIDKEKLRLSIGSDKGKLNVNSINCVAFESYEIDIELLKSGEYVFIDKCGNLPAFISNKKVISVNTNSGTLPSNGYDYSYFYFDFDSGEYIEKNFSFRPSYTEHLEYHYEEIYTLFEHYGIVDGPYKKYQKYAIPNPDAIIFGTMDGARHIIGRFHTEAPYYRLTSYELCSIEFNTINKTIEYTIKERKYRIREIISLYTLEEMKLEGPGVRDVGYYSGPEEVAYYSSSSDIVSEKREIISMINESWEKLNKKTFPSFCYIDFENMTQNDITFGIKYTDNYFSEISKTFSFNDEQKELLKIYDYPLYIECYYNINNINEFVHLICMVKFEERDDTYEKKDALFFVFRTKLKSKE